MWYRIALPSFIKSGPGVLTFLWARELIKMGHNIKVMSPHRVKPYIGSTKNDYKDAEGICEAVSRPKMLFVPIKKIEQQDIQSIHRVRIRLIESRTALKLLDK